MLWTPDSDPAGPADWKHGGIPLAWPWFGRLGDGDSHIHGYAWKSDFRVSARTGNSVVMAMETECAALEHEVRLREGALTLELRTRNKSMFALPLSVAFHPYFRVGERDETTVEGFAAGLVQVTNSVDRGVSFGAPSPRHECVLHDNARHGSLRIISEGATGLNMWNPGPEKLCPGVIPGDEWRRFVAVEPLARGTNRFLVLDPGESHVLRMTLTP